MSFKPGQSGNPKGRPPIGLTVADVIRQKCGPCAEAIIKRMIRRAERAKSEMVRQRADEHLWLRGYGPPPAVVMSVGPPPDLSRLTRDEFEEFNRLLSKCLPVESSPSPVPATPGRR